MLTELNQILKAFPISPLHTSYYIATSVLSSGCLPYLPRSTQGFP